MRVAFLQDARRRNCDDRLDWTAAMKQHLTLIGTIIVGATLCASVDRPAPAVESERVMTASGTFDVKVTPQPKDDAAAGPFGRFFLDKRFRGDLDGSSRGQMLAAETPVDQSGAYVAFELVTGALNGKQGSFVLQHKGTMRGGVYAMDISVVRDSGTGELKGISGTMTIVIEGSRHSYELTYTLAP